MDEDKPCRSGKNDFGGVRENKKAFQHLLKGFWSE